MMLYELLGVSRSQLLPEIGIPEYHRRYAHLNAVERFVRLHLGL